MFFWNLLLSENKISTNNIVYVLKISIFASNNSFHRFDLEMSA